MMMSVKERREDISGFKEAISVLTFYKAHKFVRDINVFTRDDFLYFLV